MIEKAIEKIQLSQIALSQGAQPMKKSPLLISSQR